MTIRHTTDNTFTQDVLHSTTPVLVDFWAEWCAPCKRIAPTLEEIAHEQQDVAICKLDIVANPQTTANFDVKGLPSLLLFRNGEVIGRKVGVLSKAQILDFLAQANVNASE